MGIAGAALPGGCGRCRYLLPFACRFYDFFSHKREAGSAGIVAHRRCPPKNRPLSEIVKKSCYAWGLALYFGQYDGNVVGRAEFPDKPDTRGIKLVFVYVGVELRPFPRFQAIIERTEWNGDLDARFQYFGFIFRFVEIILLPVANAWLRQARQ